METDIAGRIVAIARAWIGTPFVHQASVQGVGCDCLGLLRGIWRELYGDEPEEAPPYSLDWAEATGAETLHAALSRHADAIDIGGVEPGDILLFRMLPHGPAKRCGVLGCKNFISRGQRSMFTTLIHSRQNKQVSEESFTPFWRNRLAYAFRIGR